jgi:predicted DNA-binding WGR domain protein
MKLVKQTRLVFREGRSDKVYEIDLCEVGASQFVVNFRYGKRGSALKDGSKTVAPVKRDEAERVFDKLARSKLDAGYVEEGAAPAARATPGPAPTARTARPEAARAGEDPRAQRILERLATRDTGRPRSRAGRAQKPWPLERVIWRAGELQLRAAEPLLIALIGTAAPAGAADRDAGMRDYCIAWALGRCGGDAAVRALTTLQGHARTPAHVKRIAAVSLLLLGNAAAHEEARDLRLLRLPKVLADAARGGDAEQFAAALDAFPLHEHAHVLHELYVIDSPATRPAVLDALGKAPLRAPLFQQLRYIFKAAELRGDARVFGILGYRIETTAANPRRNYGPPTEGFGPATRLYLRRRIWRMLRRLGEAGDPAYTRMAAGVLLAFSDCDAVEPRQTSDRRGRPIHWDQFAPYLAFNHILYRNSQRYVLRRNSLAWRLTAAHGVRSATPHREEAFPQLWEQNPAALMQLCAESACTPVHEFAGKALLACPAFLDQLEIDDVILLLGRPYEATARVGFVVAQRRYATARPDLALLAALAACVHAPGRAQAFTWIDEQRVLALADSSLLAALVLGRPPDTRAFARRLLRSSALAPQVGQALIGRLIAGLLALPGGEGEIENQLAVDAAQTITGALGAHLATVSVAVIRDLLGHGLAAVQELGAELLLRHDSRSGLIPPDLILMLLHSRYDSVRAAGLRLLGELPDAVLATMDQLLVRLCSDANADVRNASRPLVLRIAASYPGTRDQIVAGLIDALLRRKLADEVPSHVLRLLKEELATGHASVDHATIWRLLSSGSPHAQELGGILLATNVAPEDLDLEQIIALASHEILSVRQAAWSMYEHGIARVQASMAQAVRIVDARWLDSRQWAFAFFRRAEFARGSFTADVLVSVIDSVRDDVQAFGRELVQRHFDDADGPALLVKLSEHPSRAVQLFATNYLERFAAGGSAGGSAKQRIEPLMPYFASVLARVNQGRIAKHRVLAFLSREGARDPVSAGIVIPLLFRLAATISIEYRASALEAMMAIHRACPEVALPLRIRPVRVVAARPAAGAARVAGGGG